MKKEYDPRFQRGPNNHYERTNNKRYRAKKQRYREKMQGGQVVIGTSESIFSDHFDSDTWLVSELKQSVSGKVVSCFSLDTSNTKLIESHNEIISSVVIGDYVVLIEDTIESIVTRSNLLARYKGDSERFSLHKRMLQPIAANLDCVVIVASARDPKFQPGFIDRYMVLAESCQIPTIICISKSELERIDDPILRWYEKSLKIPVIYTSSNTGEGVDALKELLRGETVVFVGKSGVGKSSLANIILGADIIHTSAVSEKGGQGRHTTTTSKMHEWDEKSYIIDTPGIRSLDFLEFSKEELQLYFPEFEEPSKWCYFRDCLHDQEPNCGVKDAVEQGKIPRMRYSTYLRILSEL